MRFVFFSFNVLTAAWMVDAFSTTMKPPPKVTPKVNGEADKPLYMPTKVLPSPSNLEASSTRRLSRLEVQQAITDVKRFVEARLESDLHVIRVSRMANQSKYTALLICERSNSLSHFYSDNNST